MRVRAEAAPLRGGFAFSYVTSFLNFHDVELCAHLKTDGTPMCFGMVGHTPWIVPWTSCRVILG